MRRSQISQLIQMGSIGVSDTTPVDSPCHPEGALSAQPRATPRTLLSSQLCPVLRQAFCGRARQGRRSRAWRVRAPCGAQFPKSAHDVSVFGWSGGRHFGFLVDVCLVSPLRGKKMSGDCAPERVEAGLAVLFRVRGILDHEVHRRFRQSVHDRRPEAHWGTVHGAAGAHLPREVIREVDSGARLGGVAQ
jgi:hypothetical protein